jgi:predicted molibdopterin-dependent oxidoreductase YjgC
MAKTPSPYGGASLSTEKSYLLGKFARVALGTRHIDYNGRLCMVSTGRPTNLRSASTEVRSLGARSLKQKCCL